MKKRIIVFLVVLVFIFTGMAYATQTRSSEIVDIMKIDNSGIFGTLTKGVVTFSHTKHNVDYEIKCDSCHHIKKNKENIWQKGDKVQRCVECHKSPKENQDEMLSLYNAMHKGCRDCHRTYKKGPVKCDECHPKK